VLVKMKASGLCGSAPRAIYHEHTGSGAERYKNVVAGHDFAAKYQKQACIKWQTLLLYERAEEGFEWFRTKTARSIII
jgi:hypothetical protein